MRIGSPAWMTPGLMLAWKLVVTDTKDMHTAFDDP